MCPELTISVTNILQRNIERLKMSSLNQLWEKETRFSGQNYERSDILHLPTNGHPRDPLVSDLRTKL